MTILPEHVSRPLSAIFSSAGLPEHDIALLLLLIGRLIRLRERGVQDQLMDRPLTPRDAGELVH